MWNTYASSSYMGAGIAPNSPNTLGYGHSRQRLGARRARFSARSGQRICRQPRSRSYQPCRLCSEPVSVASLSLILLASRAVLFLLDHLIACRNSECPSRLRISMLGMTQCPPITPGKYFTGGKNLISCRTTRLRRNWCLASCNTARLPVPMRSASRSGWSR